MRLDGNFISIGCAALLACAGSAVAQSATTQTPRDATRATGHSTRDTPPAPRAPRPVPSDADDAARATDTDTTEPALKERVARIIDRSKSPPEPQRAGRRMGPTQDAGHVTSLPAATNQPWLLNTLAALGVVIGLILFLRYVWTKVGGRASVSHSPVVEVLSRTTVAPKNHVVLVRVGGRVLICGDSPAGLRTLADVQEPEQVAELLGAISAAREGSMTRGFNQLLGRYNGEHDRVAATSQDDETRIDSARESVSSLLSRIRSLAGKRGAA